MATMEEIVVGLKGYSIPKQFVNTIEIDEVVSTVSSETAEQMSEEFRRECSIHDADDRESWVAADTIYAGQ